MTVNRPQSDHGGTQAEQAARDEEELLDVLAGHAVDQLLHDQAADLNGAAAGIDEDTPLVEGARENDDGPYAGPDVERTVTAEELDALFGPSADTYAPPTDEQDAADTLDDLFPETSPTGDTAAAPAAPADDDDGESGPVTQADLDAMFTRSDEPETPSGTDGPVSQADLDALFAQADGQVPPSADNEKADDGAATPETLNAAFAEAEASGDEDAASAGAVAQADLDAFFAKGPEQTPAAAPDEPPADGPPEPAAEAPPETAAAGANETMSQADLDALFAQAAGETPDETAEATDEAALDATLERQQVDHPDTPEPPPAAAEAVSAAEAGALRDESSADAPPPIERLEDLDALLAERAEQGAAAADLASDPVGRGTDDLADHEPAPPEADTASPAAPAAAPPTPVAAASPVAEAPPPSETITPPSTAELEGEPAPPAPAQPARPRADWRASVLAVLDAVNRPFAPVPPAVRDILGYAGIALLGAAFFLVLLTLMR